MGRGDYNMTTPKGSGDFQTGTGRRTPWLVLEEISRFDPPPTDTNELAQPPDLDHPYVFWPIDFQLARV